MMPVKPFDDSSDFSVRSCAVDVKVDLKLVLDLYRIDQVNPDKFKFYVISNFRIRLVLVFG